MTIAPDYAEPIVGWRFWLVAETAMGIRLRSVFHETEWPPCQAVRATCAYPAHLYVSRGAVGGDRAAEKIVAGLGAYGVPVERTSEDVALELLAAA